MKTNALIKIQALSVRKKFTGPGMLLSCLLLHAVVQAKPVERFNDLFVEHITDTVIESKVDYLERIYFSGENKDGLNIKILIALQELQRMTPTPALAKQATFLIDIKDKAGAADNSCDILDLLAVGIYNIDAAEAVQQGVRTPSEKAKAKSVDALATLNKLNSTSNNLSSSARNLEWSSYLLSGGRYGSFASGAAKVANTAGTIGNVVGAAGEAGQTVQQLGEVGKSLGISFKKKDKSCDDVPKKDIVIGEHLAIPANTNVNSNINNQQKDPALAQNSSNKTIITIVGIDYAKLSAMEQNIKACAMVKSTSKKFNISESTIEVIHTGTTEELLNLMFQTCKDNFTAANLTKQEDSIINIKL